MCGTGESHKLGVGDTKDRETPTAVEALEVQRATCGLRFILVCALHTRR